MSDGNGNERVHFLIIRLSSLGDIIHTLPAYASLRKAYPEARITWLAEEKGRQILSLVPGIDRIALSHIKQQTLVTPAFWKELTRIRKMISRRNQTAFDFQGLMKSGIYAGLSRSRRRYGFHRRNLRESGARLFYTKTLPPLPEFIHIIDKNINLLSLAGIKSGGYEFPIHFPERLQQNAAGKLNSAGYANGQALVVLNVGAAWTTKQWPANRWIEVLTNTDFKGAFPLVLWGNEQERQLAESIAGSSPGQLSPSLNLQEVMALLHKARLVVSGDTFALQAACALDRPVLALFGPTHPARNGPFRGRDRVIFHRLDCSYCYKRQCRDMTCMKKITAAEVQTALKEMLDIYV
jgi:lipopolysaccharide heptosyltransferase I